MTSKQFARFVAQHVDHAYNLEAFTTDELENVVAEYFSNVEDPRTALYFQVLAQAGSFALDGFYECFKKAFADRDPKDVCEAYSAYNNALEKAVQNPTLYQELKKQ
jgi:hypothetical protein